MILVIRFPFHFKYAIQNHRRFFNRELHFLRYLKLPATQQGEIYGSRCFHRRACAEWRHPVGHKEGSSKASRKDQTLNPSIAELWEHIHFSSLSMSANQSRILDSNGLGKNMVCRISVYWVVEDVTIWTRS